MHPGLIGLLPDGAATRVESGSVLGGASMAMREGGRFGADDGGRLLSFLLSCVALLRAGRVPGDEEAIADDFLAHGFVHRQARMW